MKQALKLRPHQQEAHDAVIGAFKDKDRCHIIMACGTGKTLTSLAIAESMSPQSIVIFVPSLALINQFMKEWVTNTSWLNFQILAVCSDKSVAKGVVEDESLLLEKICFPVSNNIYEIKNFLNKKNGNVKVIFSTYQSAMLLCGLEFEVGIFDEAHKTAGYNKGLYGYPLFDKNIKIAKRLFMTATPRRAFIKGRKSKEDKFVYSMDDEELYGQRVYALSFRKAINLGLICNYKVIVSVLEHNAQYITNKKFEMQEKAIALYKSIVTTGAKKIITFHGSVKDASDFASIFRKCAPKNIDISHISSKQKLDDRALVMNTFKSASSAILTNAKCLTEGVDVPAIDMVAFMSPKSSTIDVIQAIGRCLRNSFGKTTGYIFLPLLINLDNLASAGKLEYGKYNYIWQILSSISEQDSELTDIIRNLSTTNEKYFNSKVLNNYVKIHGMSANIENLIGVKLISELKNEWEDMCIKLTNFKKINGHFNIKREEDYELFKWLNKQCSNYKCNKMNNIRVKKLKKIGFNFLNSYDTTWFKNLKLYNAYKKGKRPSVTPEFNALGWGRRQRKDYRDQKLEKNKIDALKKTGFIFSSLSKKRINDKIQDLLDYKNKHGNWEVPAGTILGKWVRKMRKLNKNGTINIDTQKKLKDMEFDFEIKNHNEQVWNENYALYLKLKDTPELGYHLSWWITLQREAKEKGVLSKDRIKKLLLAGFVFRDHNIRISTLKIIARLQDFYKKNKTYMVPAQAWNKETHSLYVNTMKWRKAKREGTLDKNIEDKLNEIGFTWEGAGSGNNFKNAETHPKIRKEAQKR